MGPETGANKLKGDEARETKQGKQDELVAVSVSALDKLWQGSEGHGHQDLDSAVFSPVEATAEVFAQFKNLRLQFL